MFNSSWLLSAVLAMAYLARPTDQVEGVYVYSRRTGAQSTEGATESAKEGATESATEGIHPTAGCIYDRGPHRHHRRIGHTGMRYTVYGMASVYGMDRDRGIKRYI